MFENLRRGRQARNFTTNAPKILNLKSSSEQMFSRKLPLGAPGRCFLFPCTVFFFPFWFSLFLLLTLPVVNLDQWYFKLKSGVLFWKRDFKSSLSAYWPSLWPDKNHKPCQDMSLLWNSWILTHSTPQTVLIYTQHPPVIHWQKLNLPFAHRLDHQHYHPKTSTGSATKK